MKKIILKIICPIIGLTAWALLLLWVCRVEDEILRSCAIIGALGIGYVFLRIYYFCELYQNYKELYELMRDANRNRRLSYYAGDSEKVRDFSEWIEATGDDMKEAFEFLSKNFPGLPKGRLRQMNKDVERMMNNNYPPV